jgi:hypothetical protein
MVSVWRRHKMTIGEEWRKHREFLFCSVLVVVAVVIANHGGGRPERRITFLELNLGAAVLVGFVTNFIASLFYVAYHEEQSDAWALAGARVGVALSIILFAAALFRFRSLFSVWWVWDRALVWIALVVPVYVSYLLLREYANPGQGPTLGAAFGILAFLDLLLAYFAVVLRATRVCLSKQFDGAYSLTASMWWIVALAAAATWLMYRWEIIQRKDADQDAMIVA